MLGSIMLGSIMFTCIIRVEAPHFVAGLILNEAGICVEAAPILRWAVGKRREELLPYFKRKKWAARIIQ